MEHSFLFFRIFRIMTIHIHNTDIFINLEINFWMVFFRDSLVWYLIDIELYLIVSYHFLVSVQPSRPSLVPSIINDTYNRGHQGWARWLNRDQKVIRYDKIQFNIDKIPNKWISKKYHSEIDFEINKYVCITYVNGHNSRLLIYDRFIYEISISPWFSHRISIYIT
jgi:hypothetical protein